MRIPVRVWPVLVLFAGIALSPIQADGSSQKATEPPPVPIDQETVPLDMESVVVDFAKTHDLSINETRRVFDETQQLMDFNLKYADDPSFGAVWATYEQGYEVHVRFLDDEFATKVDQLDRSLSRPTVRSTGGLSAPQMNRAIEVLDARQTVFGTDNANGLVTIYENESEADEARLVLLDSGVSDFGIRIDSTPLEVEKGENTSGADMWRHNGSSWIRFCTASFMYEGPGGTRGVATAGHCNDMVGGTGWVNGLGTASLIGERCPHQGGDYQFVTFAGTPNVNDFGFDKRNYPHPIVQFHIAGGFYTGQPTLKAGLSTNGSAGSNTGTVGNYDGSNYGGQGDCPTGTWTVLRYTNDSDPGDSGGPIWFLYANEWYLGATHSVGGGSAGAGGQPIWWTDLPAGRQICSLDNAC